MNTANHLTDVVAHLHILQVMLAISPDGYALIDRNYVYQLVNPAYEDWCQKPERDILQHSVAEILGQALFEHQVRPNLERCFQGESFAWEDWCDHPTAGRSFVRVSYHPLRAEDDTIAGAITMVRDLTSLKQAESRLQVRADREYALNQIMQAIHQSLDLDTIFAIASDRIAQFLEAGVAIVQYQADRKRWVHLTEASHQELSANYAGAPIPDEANPFALQLKQGQVVRVDDTHHITDPVNQEVAQASPGAWLLTPIRVNGKTWGSLSLYQYHPSFRWTPEDVVLTQRVAEQLAIAIHRAELYQQLQHELVERQRAENSLRQQRTLFQSLYEQTSVGIAFYLPNGEFIQANQTFCDLLGYSEAELRPLPYSAITVTAEPLLGSPAPAAKASGDPPPAAPRGERLRGRNGTVEQQYVRKDGRHCWVQVNTTVIAAADGSVERIAKLVTDISDRKQIEAEQQQAEAALQEREEQYRLLFHRAEDMIFVHSLAPQNQGTFIAVNDTACRLLGYSQAELLALTLDDLAIPDDTGNNPNLSQAILHNGSCLFEQTMVTKDGRHIPVEHHSHLFTYKGHPTCLTISRNITERKQAEAQLRHNALHDTLTQLPNRNSLMVRLELALKRAKRQPDYLFAILFLDLDRFKLVNDSLGHQAGDQLLVTISQRLCQVIRPTDLAARLGGDEFIVLLEEINALEDATAIAQRLIATLQQPVVLSGREVVVTSSIGIVLGPGAYTHEADLMRDADIAMYWAKAQGKNRYALFDPTMHNRVLRQVQLESDLRRAIADGQLVAYYQPIVNLQTGLIDGFEALVRWQHPQYGLVSPGEFIAIAEETGLIASLGQWMLQTACQQLKQWRDSYPQLPHLRMSVNLSSQQMFDTNLADAIGQLLSDLNLEGRYLTLDMSEGMLTSDTRTVIATMDQLHARSICLSIDDFGTGYSSLSQLHRFPIDALKIDHSFIGEMDHDSVNRNIVETIIALADRLGLNAIAEGVETPDQIQLLQSIGCEYAQGKQFAPPLPAAAATHLLTQPQLLFLAN